MARLAAASRRGGHGIYLGEGRGGAVFAPPELGALVLGPPRSGKTSAIVVPNVLCASGSVVAVSTKLDVLAATLRARRVLGPCLVFDPSGALPLPRGVSSVGWSPLAAAASWDHAVLVATSMVGASRTLSSRSEGTHWTERAGALLSTLFHAAALSGTAMDDVVSAVNRREPERFLAVLAREQSDLACDLLVGITETDAREQSGIWSTASGVLAAYRTGAALASTHGTLFDAAGFVASPATLYIATGAEHQALVAPIIAGLLRDLRSAAARHFLMRAGEEPVLVVLDELANIAPLHDLPLLIAEGASQGVLTLGCLQDLSQAVGRWGPLADGFFSLFGVKVVMAGIGDRSTLETVSLLAGERDRPVRSLSSAAGKLMRLRRGTSVTARRERRLPPDAIADGPAGSAIAIVGAHVGRVHLTPYYSSSPWSALAD